MPSGRTNNFPESGRGLGHVTPTIFGSTVGYPSDSLASCFSDSQWISLSCTVSEQVPYSDLLAKDRDICISLPYFTIRYGLSRLKFVDNLLSQTYKKN